MVAPYASALAQAETAASADEVVTRETACELADALALLVRKHGQVIRVAVYVRPSGQRMHELMARIPAAHFTEPASVFGPKPTDGVLDLVRRRLGEVYHLQVCIPRDLDFATLTGAAHVHLFQEYGGPEHHAVAIAVGMVNV
jgi:hypothetical protein